jgi:hypothetical protein
MSGALEKSRRQPELRHVFPNAIPNNEVGHRLSHRSGFGWRQIQIA